MQHPLTKLDYDVLFEPENELPYTVIVTFSMYDRPFQTIRYEAKTEVQAENFIKEYKDCGRWMQ